MQSNESVTHGSPSTARGVAVGGKGTGYGGPGVPPEAVIRRHEQYWQRVVGDRVARLKPLAKGLLQALLDHADNCQGTCWPGPTTLARRLGCNANSIYRSRGELEALHLIEIRYKFDRAQYPERINYIYRVIGYERIWVEGDGTAASDGGGVDGGDVVHGGVIRPIETSRNTQFSADVTPNSELQTPNSNSNPNSNQKSAAVPAPSTRPSRSGRMSGNGNVIDDAAAAQKFALLTQIDDLDQDWAWTAAHRNERTVEYVQSVVERCQIEGHSPGWVCSAIEHGGYSPFAPKRCPKGEAEDRLRKSRQSIAAKQAHTEAVQKISYADWRRIGDRLAEEWPDYGEWWAANPSKSNFTFGQKIVVRWNNERQ